jgi:hypothetical protein
MNLVKDYFCGSRVTVGEMYIAGLSRPAYFDKVFFVKTYADSKSVAGFLGYNDGGALCQEVLCCGESDAAPIANQRSYVDKKALRLVWIVLTSEAGRGKQNGNEDSEDPRSERSFRKTKV